MINKTFTIIIFFASLLYISISVLVTEIYIRENQWLILIKETSITLVFISILSIIIVNIFNAKIKVLKSKIDTIERDGLSIIATIDGVASSIPHNISNNIKVDDIVSASGLYRNNKIDVYSLFNHSTKVKSSSNYFMYLVSFLLCLFGVIYINTNNIIVGFLSSSERISFSAMIVILMTLCFIMVVLMLVARMKIRKTITDAKTSRAETDGHPQNHA